MQHDPVRADTERIPLFPLHTVLLPGAHLSLRVFEPRYRRLVSELVSGKHPDREFGVVAIRNALVNDVATTEELHGVGCTARLRQVQRRGDGRSTIVTTGSRRFRLVKLVTDEAPYLLGDVEWMLEGQEPPESARTAAMAAAARAAHDRYCAAAWTEGDWSSPPADTELTQLAYLLAADCLLPLTDRQSLLTESDALRRLLLNREAGFLIALGAVPAQHGELGDPDAHALN